jgi:UDP-N-acetylmuramoylalanine--D-glutamate ligase
MTPVTTFAGRTVALFGLGGSGLTTALALKAGGARVIACDDSAEAMAKAEGQGIETGDLRAADWSGFAALVLSPGVPLTHPEPHWSVRLAKAAGVEVIGDIELFCRERAKIAPEASFIAITGTNGKSTTTALIAHILREAGRDVQMGGNIGTAILSLEPPAPDRYHVAEMSSFQIDLTPSLRPSIGVLLNISPDHLDRHGSMENYVAIKERLVLSAEQAVIGFDDDHCREICGRLLPQDRPVFPISRENSLAGAVFYEDGFLCRVIRTAQARWVGERLLDLQGVSSLRGAHNGQNAAAAFSVCEALDISHDLIAKALKTFPGLPHRMEEVGRLGRAIFVNDSKATNADSTEKALAAFDRVFWILGGKAKEGGIESLRSHFSKIERAYLVGEAADAFAATLEGAVPVARSGTLDRAVAQAAEDAAKSSAKEPAVLLSPACASYDQFKNFEERGNRFRDLVRALPGIEVKGL